MANPENLKPFPKGVSGNPKGRPKGVKNWSTVVQQLLADETLIDKVVTTKPAYWEQLPTRNAANAIVVAMMIKALQWSMEAANWLKRTGFGDKLMLEFEDGLFKAEKIKVEIVRTPSPDERDAES